MAASSSSRSESPQVESQVRAYLAALPAEPRTALEKIREAIRTAVPAAVEGFSYGMPAFRLGDGRPFIWYAAWKHHIGLYPISEAIIAAHADELQGTATSKGTVRFPLTRPPSANLVKRLAKARAAESRTESGR